MIRPVAHCRYLAFTNQTTWEVTSRQNITFLQSIPENVLPFSRGVYKNLYEFCIGNLTEKEVSAAGPTFDSTREFLDIRFEFRFDVDPRKKNADFNTVYTLASRRNTFDPERVGSAEDEDMPDLLQVVLLIKAQLNDTAFQVKKLQGVVDGKGHTPRAEKARRGVKTFRAWQQRSCQRGEIGTRALSP
ncbi:hypothetical protein CYMTET_42886 [Cymbomonas tetramitiformis]|uniref:Uncharacterized protein n=1 Tax=Cymbomonas tetramitiformis TaxID=36881 RepID=A0AAE0C574_9CHLO|nr:hypothetical protein CYMTET_42886 [Cymbomonas tetramitiformis]